MTLIHASKVKKLVRIITNPKLLLTYAPKLILAYAKNKSREYREHSWAKSDAKKIQNFEKVLFVDLGANLGQGYQWFMGYFKQPNISFELFEPNPFCYEELKKLPDIVSGKTSVHNVGVGAVAGSFKFYGLDESEGGKFSQGGSTVREHNSIWYKSSDTTAIDVEIINFSEYLIEKAKSFNKIIVKMDIEGAEVELLENLISSKTIEKINTLYVEFHSQYEEINQSVRTKSREQAILQVLTDLSDLKVRIWH
jgi:FkbM family methyltransferase